MKEFRLIISNPGTGAENMALDEALFESSSLKDSVPTLRLYSWSQQCVTIGYFQKYGSLNLSNLPVTRRITGGLLVRHINDISYSLIVSKKNWRYLYDQDRTYFQVHSCILKGLSLLGINCSFHLSPKNDRSLHDQNNLSERISSAVTCVKTLFNHDLMIYGRKIVGSSQRRRGANLLQQGSIHIDRSQNFNYIVNAITDGFSKSLDIDFNILDPNDLELARMDFFLKYKYKTDEWNKKF